MFCYVFANLKNNIKSNWKYEMTRSGIIYTILSAANNILNL